MKDIQELVDASDVLGWLAEASDEISGDDPKTLEMKMALVLAQTYVTEYAHHRSHGKTHAEALAATARGELDITRHIEQRKKSLN